MTCCRTPPIYESRAWGAAARPGDPHDRTVAAAPRLQRWVRPWCFFSVARGPDVIGTYATLVPALGPAPKVDLTEGRQDWTITTDDPACHWSIAIWRVYR